jgi:hypothetical protein
MSRSGEKDIASATLMAGGILLALTDALSDVSQVSPTVHLKALVPDDPTRKIYVKEAAEFLDERLFVENHLAAAREYFPYDIYGLTPVWRVPLRQAFDWARVRGYDDYISTPEEVQALGIPRAPYTTERGVIAYFNLCGSSTCEEVEWGPFGNFGIVVRTHELADKDVIKPGQMLLMAKP